MIPQLVKTRVTDFHGVIPNVSTTKTRVFNPYYAVDATQKKRVFTSVLRHVGFIMIDLQSNRSLRLLERDLIIHGNVDYMKDFRNCHILRNLVFVGFSSAY